MEKKLPISVVMIAHNEAKRLPQSLGSVVNWVSEIVVVINDCSDNTEAVARSFGAKVSEHPFENLRDQKTVALHQATQPWVLSLDADEVVSIELREEIFRFFAHPPEDVNGVWFPRCLWFMNRWMKHGDTYPDRVLRLFRNGRGQLGGTEEHDCFVVEGKTIRFKHDLLHYSHESVASHVNKINFFSDFFLRRAVLQGRRVNPLTAIGRGYWRFIRAYFLRLGFLDGFPGFYMAFFAAFATFVKYTKLYEHEITAEPSVELAPGDEVAVILAPNEAYAVQAGVAIFSILRHAQQPGHFHFYLLQDQKGIAVTDTQKLRDIVHEYGAKLDHVAVDPQALAGLQQGLSANYLPFNAFYRMLIPQLLPQLDRCIYLDCDVVALDDLVQLWQIDISAVAVGVVRDWHVEGRGLSKYQTIRHYFNSGVLYLNLKKCRERHYVQECLRLAADPEITKRYSDQDVLNLVFCDDLKLLHPRWNMQTGQGLLCKLYGVRHGDPSWREVKKHPGIAHYSGRKRKPWYFDMKHKYAMAYWENFQLTPWGRETAMEPLLRKARGKNFLARLYDLLKQCLTIKFTPQRGIYILIVLGIILIDITPNHDRLD